MTRWAALALAACATLAAAGCGGGSSAPYTATGTAPCLRDKGFTHVTTDPGKVGFIAGFAENGGLRATTPDDNVLTIAFTEDEEAVPGIERAFARVAPPQYKHHMQDITESQRNAVLVWTVTPQQQQLDDALGCLHP
jgi:hypothetical protein